MNTRKGFVGCAAVAALCLFMAGGADALANTVWHVSSSAPSGTCGSPTFTCKTINAAVSGADDFDIIVVGPGTYTESVYVNKQVEIFGAQAGIDARDRRQSSESIVDATGQSLGPGSGAAFNIVRNNVVIDGFTLQGGTSGDAAAGVYEDDQFTTQITNDIIQNNAVGICLNMTGDGNNTVIEDNLIRNNNEETAGSDYSPSLVPGRGFGIVASEVYKGLTIRDNAFECNLAAAMFLYDTIGTYITGNTSNNDGSFLVLDYTSDVTVSYNEGQNFGAKGSYPIVRTTPADAAIELLFDNWPGVNISDNTFCGGKAPNYSGIDFSAMADVHGNYPDLGCWLCSITNNRITHFTGNGIVAEFITDYATLPASQITHNHIEHNGGVGILIEKASNNAYNQVRDCEDDTSGSLTASTADNWFNNSPGTSSPSGLCGPGVRNP